MTERPDVLIVGSGNAALCAGLAALERGATVHIIEKATPELGGGNSRYTAGAMRFAYNDASELVRLLADPSDPRLALADFGSYPESTFAADLLGFNDGHPLSPEQEALVGESHETVRWMSSLGVFFEPNWARQSFVQDGRHVFWGGLPLSAAGEGTGLVDAELARFIALGGSIAYECAAVGLITEGDAVTGVVAETGGGEQCAIAAGSVVLACGGFESNPAMRVEHLGPQWERAVVRGTPHNTGVGLELAYSCGAVPHGFYQGCHATPMDLHTKPWGGLELPPTERKRFRKISYFLGIMLNAAGERFVDEGRNFRNYTYAQFGAEILDQPGHVAWQIFDAKVLPLLYDEYDWEEAHFAEADSIVGLLAQLEGLDGQAAQQTVARFNDAVDDSVDFDPSVLDAKSTQGLTPPKTNWAQRLDTPPFRAYPVTGGITFTYGGLKVDDHGAVLRSDDSPIEGLFGCGELVGGVFRNGYPGGSGLTSGAVFGRRAGHGAARSIAGR